MAFDPSKLTPLPWMFTPPGHIDYPAVVKASGWPILMSEDDNADDLAFAALARNAWDVMMRRGWGVAKPFDDGWIVCGQGTADLAERKMVYADPFTALVETDRRAN